MGTDRRSEKESYAMEERGREVKTAAMLRTVSFYSPVDLPLLREGLRGSEFISFMSCHSARMVDKEGRGGEEGMRSSRWKPICRLMVGMVLITEWIDTEGRKGGERRALCCYEWKLTTCGGGDGGVPFLPRARMPWPKSWSTLSFLTPYLCWHLSHRAEMRNSD